MLRSLREVVGYQVTAIDGVVGNVDELYFDDHEWKIRYLVVNTGNWLSGRRVLVSPQVLGTPGWTDRRLSVNLTKKRIKDSPDVDLVQPISRRQEARLRDYYQWPIYWGGFSSPVSPASTGQTPDSLGLDELDPMPDKDPNRYWHGFGTPTTPGPAAPQPTKDTERPSYDSHLRSSKELIGYQIEARDGEIGQVEDFMLDEEDWSIHFLVVNNFNWLPDKKILISPRMIEKISWSQQKIRIDMLRTTIRNNLEHDSAKPVIQNIAVRDYVFLSVPEMV